MFAITKTSFAVLALASFSRATLTIQPFNLIPNTTNTISWTSSDIDKDPATFSIELINDVFHSQFAVANNVLTTSGSASFPLPAVLPGDGFTIQFVDVGNINMVIANSSTFSIAEHDAGAPLPSGQPSASGVRISSTASPSTSSSVPATVTQSSPSTIRSAPTVSGTTPLSSSTPTGSAASGTAASAGASSPAPTPSNSAAIALVPTGSFAALVAGLLALAL